MLELIHEAKWLTLLLFCVWLSLHAVYCCNISACVWSSGCWSWSMRPQVADVVVVFCVWLSLHAVYCCNISACVWSSGCWSWSMRPSGWRCCCFVCGCHSMQFTVVTSLPVFDPQGAGADPWGQVADVVVVFCVVVTPCSLLLSHLCLCLILRVLELIHEATSGWRCCCFLCGCHSMQFTVVTSLPVFDPQGAGADPWGQVADVVVVLCVVVTPCSLLL